MDLATLEQRNRLAQEKVPEFRRLRSASNIGIADAQFHEYKNKYPYFGHVEVELAGERFLMFSAHDDLIAMIYFWHGPDAFERMSMATWLKHCDGALEIFDVGAHTGVYGLAAASANKRARIHAFEPVRRTYGRLLSNISVNNFGKRIISVNKGLSNQENQDLRINQFRGEYILGAGASILKKNVEVVSSDELVQITTGDLYAEQSGIVPDLLKIDVEGAELLVLEGMRGLLEKRRPKMLIEVTPDTAPAVNRILTDLGYEIHQVDERLNLLMRFPGEAHVVMNLFADHPHPPR